MKRKFYNTLFISFIFLLFTGILQAQEDESDVDNNFDITNAMEQPSEFSTNFLYSRIGDRNFIGLRLEPELAIGKLGFGLSVPIMFDMNDWSFRTEEFTSGSGVLRMIRYVRWGIKKKDPIYIKVGDLSGASLGFGLLLNNYTNSVSFENRKFGMEFDILIKNFFGLEFIYSDFDFTSLNLMAFRPYIKPLGTTKIPIIKTFEIGFSYVVDKDQTSIKTDSMTVKNNEFLENGISAWGLDAGIIPINNRWMQMRIFAQYGNLKEVNSDLLTTSLNFYALNNSDSALIVNYAGASGISVGMDFRFKFLGNLLRMDIRAERLWYNDHFMPQFFDATYEMHKDAKIFQLTEIKKKTGTYAALNITVLEKILVSGGVMIPDQVSLSAPATLHIGMDASRLSKKLIIRGDYYKGNITKLAHALQVDDNSLLSARIAYKLYKYLAIGIDYKWTFAEMDDGTYKTTNHVSPYIGLNIPLNFGKKDKKVEDEEKDIFDEEHNN